MSNSPLNVFITGGTSGFGYELILRLMNAGHKVKTITRTKEQAEELNDSLMKVTGDGSCFMYPGFDLAHPRIEQLIFNFANRRAPDVLVNCAGYSQWGPVETLSIDEMEEQFRVNTITPMLFASAFMPVWRRESRGHVINIGSTIDDNVKPFGGMYTASKVALRALTLALAAEVKPWGVHVTLIEPHAYKTRYSQNRKIPTGHILTEYLERHETTEPVRDREAPDPKPVIDLLEDLITIPSESVNLTKEQVIFRV